MQDVGGVHFARDILTDHSAQDLLPEYYLEHYLRFLVECIPHVLKPSDPKGEFAAMTSQGRDFVSVEDVEGISERFCRSAVASVRRLAFANKLHSVRVYQVVCSSAVRVTHACPLHLLWLRNLSR